MPHHVIVVETGGIETPWRTWAQCQSCEWRGPERVDPKLVDQDAKEHANA